MARFAFLFPGQGSQEVGMGRDLFARDPFARELVERASEAAGADLSKLCQRGPSSLLARTEALQPALACVSLGLWRLLDAAGAEPAAVAGHSLGELPALAASGMADPGEMAELAALRGRLMAGAAARQEGGMIAVTGLPASELCDTLERFPKDGVLAVGAVNAPDQVTVSGDPERIEAFSRSLDGRPGVRVTRLRVSGAWHSSHMAPAVEPFRSALQALSWKVPTRPMLFNRTGLEAAPEAVSDLLAEQLTCPVRWDLVIQRMLALGVTDFVEVGPGRVLGGLVRRNAGGQELRVHQVSDLRSLDRALAALAGSGS